MEFKFFKDYKYHEFLKYTSFIYNDKNYIKKRKYSLCEDGSIIKNHDIDDRKVIPLTFKDTVKKIITFENKDNIRKENTRSYQNSTNLLDILPLEFSYYFTSEYFPNIFEVNFVTEEVKEINLKTELTYMKKVFQTNKNDISLKQPTRFFMFEKFKDKFVICLKLGNFENISKKLTNKEKEKYKFVNGLACFYGDDFDEIEERLFYLKMKGILTNEHISCYYMNQDFKILNK